MYTVVNFNLPGGLDVKLKDSASFNFFHHAGEVVPNKLIAIEVPDSGGEHINLMKYVVGERIVFRKSLTGLKLIRGLPDYTGAVTNVDLVGQIPEMVQKVQYRYQERQASYKRHPKIMQSNLCMEIPMPGGSPGIDWANLTSARDEGPEDTIGALMAQQMADMADRGGFTRQILEGTGTVTGRVTGQRGDAGAYHAPSLAAILEANRIGTRNLYYQRGGNFGRSQPTTEMSRRYQNDFTLWSSDFDGDTALTQSLLSSRHANAPRAQTVHDEVPPRYIDNRHEITEVDLSAAIRATAEVVQGERGRPPASRGPRPRNQRW